jgi:hypothetical protein
MARSLFFTPGARHGMRAAALFSHGAVAGKSAWGRLLPCSQYIHAYHYRQNCRGVCFRTETSESRLSWAVCKSMQSGHLNESGFFASHDRNVRLYFLSFTAETAGYPVMSHEDQQSRATGRDRASRFEIHWYSGCPRNPRATADRGSEAFH